MRKMGLTYAHEHVVSYHRSSSQFKTYDLWLQNKLTFLIQYDPNVSVWAHKLSRKIFAEVETESFFPIDFYRSEGAFCNHS